MDGDSVLDRALGYPYDPPDRSYLFDTATGELQDLDLATLDVSGRHAVLAVGSNASPSQLRRKFDERCGADGLIPVLRVELADHDVVFAATIAHYGSVPATLTCWPGCIVRVHLTLLDDDQLTCMHQTEGLPQHYTLDPVDSSLVDAGIDLPGDAAAYVSTAGPLLVDGAPVALSAVEGRGRSLVAMSQREILEHVARRESTTVDELVAALVASPSKRQAVSARLRTRT